MGQALFQSFFLGGFECSCHRVRSGKRLDMLAATNHPQHAVADFRRLQEQGIFTARSGIRWHLIETKPHRYDFSSVLPILSAARETGMQVIWDLCHYGWPDDLDLFSPAFVERFQQFAAAFARLLAAETDATPFLAPINEISYFAWAAGDVACMHPFSRNRGDELKAQLVRASIAAIEAIWAVAPKARMVMIDPVINIVADPNRPQDQEAAKNYTLAQYQAWDMLAGRLAPELGGHRKYLDIIGINYYYVNQWVHNAPPLPRQHPLYKPFRQLLQDVYTRYHRPLFVAETSIEGDERPDWLHYVCSEVRAAMRAGVPIEGICLYPILNHPGWEDDRHCCVGLWGYADETGERELYEPLAEELRRQQQLFKRIRIKRHLPMQTQSVTALPVQDHIRLTLCLFTDSPEPSGLGEHMLALATELCQRYNILFVCPPTPRGRRVLERAADLGCMTLSLDLSDEHSAYQTLAAWLRQWRVQIFHCHAGIGWEGHRGVQAACNCGVPVVIRTEHLPYLLTDRQQQAAYQALIPVVDRFICVSAEAQASHRKAGVPAEKLSLVRNGVHLPPVRPDRAGVRQEFSLPAQARIVFTAARFTEQKGHRYLLEAIPAILAAEPNTYFLWAGDGPLEQDLRHQQQTLGVAVDRLIFAGWREDVPRLLAASDLFVLPSLFEGLPLVALEALALGIPIVGTRVCGTSETVEDGVSGRLVAPGDSAALACAVSEALTKPALAAGWRQAGQQRFQECFNAERMAQETAALYEDVLARPNRSQREHNRPTATHVQRPSLVKRPGSVS